jgi:hypothetical protein
MKAQDGTALIIMKKDNYPALYIDVTEAFYRQCTEEVLHGR